MKSTPHVPDELIVFDKEFSLRTALNVCKWWLAAFCISAVCDMIFPDMKKQWPLAVRVTVVLAEFLALVLFLFDATRFIRGMDELQRRIATAALFFSVITSFLFFLFWLRLEREGFFNAIFGPPPVNGTWGISSVAHACFLTGSFYALGFVIFKRRYK